MYDSEDFCIRRVEQLRASAAVAPEPLSMDTRLAINRCVLSQEPLVEPPPWAAAICRNRQHFVATGFVFTPAGGDPAEFWRFAFAYQSPFVLAVSRMVPLARNCVRDGIGDLGVAFQDAWEHQFTLSNEYMYSFDPSMGRWHIGEVSLLQSLVSLPGGRLATHCTAAPLELFLEELPKVGPARVAEPGQRLAVPATDRVSMIAEHPWVLHHLDDGLKVLHKKRRVSFFDKHKDTADDDDDEAALDPEEVFVECRIRHLCTNGRHCKAKF
jgi:hypothetical protein